MDEVGTPDSVWLAAVSFLVWVIYIDHLYHAVKLYTLERSYRAFRNGFIAVMLQLGLTRITIGSLQIAFPDVQFFMTLRTITAPLLTFFLLTGAIVLVYTWRRDNTLKSAKHLASPENVAVNTKRRAATKKRSENKLAEQITTETTLQTQDREVGDERRRRQVRDKRH